MAHERFKYPPCVMNVMTEEPYSSHNFVIKYSDADKAFVFERKGRLYYDVVCSRCGFRDPNPPRF